LRLEKIPNDQIHLSNEKKLAVGSNIIAISEHLFLYKGCVFNEIILAPKKPRKPRLSLVPKKSSFFELSRNYQALGDTDPMKCKAPAYPGGGLFHTTRY
jgi:hypothetical protein